jgi:hypothetical protein
MALTVGPLSLLRIEQLVDDPDILQEVALLQGYRQFQDDPDNSNSLPAEQRAKIDLAADEIMQSLFTPLPAIAVIVRGHADQDLTKSGTARTRFELDISKRRAKRVSRVLQATLNSRALLFPTPLTADSLEALTRLSLMRFREEGRGARELLFPPRSDRALTEFERSMNRRVQILAAQDSQPLLGQIIMFCSHGGQILPLTPVPTTSDTFPVVNCPFATPTGPSPCVVARFVTDTELVLSESGLFLGALGQTFNSAGVLQGNIIIV